MMLVICNMLNGLIIRGTLYNYSLKTPQLIRYFLSTNISALLFKQDKHSNGQQTRLHLIQSIEPFTTLVQAILFIQFTPFLKTKKMQQIYYVSKEQVYII
jgi:hypothetical protein